MAARLIRMNDELDQRAKAYAEGLGISVNALVVISLSEYLEAKNPAHGRSRENPSPPAQTAEGKPIVLTREQRRRLDRLAKKPGKRKGFS